MRLNAILHTITLILFIASASIYSALSYPQDAMAQPSQVGTATSSQATLDSSYRKSFYDTLNNTHWAFWYDGNQIAYSKSLDGETWTPISTLAYNTPNFTVSFKEIANTSYVILTALNNSYDIILRRGVLSNSSIIFDSEVTVFNGTTSYDSYSQPTVAIDGNNKVWVGALHYNGSIGFEKYQVRAIRSTNTITNTFSSWESTHNISRRTNNISSISLIPQTSDAMYLVQNGDSNNIIGYTFDGSTWSSANTGGDYSWFSFGNNDENNTNYELNNSVNDIAYIGTDVYVAGWFTSAGSSPANRIAKWNGSAWSTLGEGVDNGVYTLATIGTDLYAGGWFVTAGGITVNKIAKWDGSTWSALGDGVNNTVLALTSIGTDLYVGGLFTQAGGIAANRVAKWNGSAWSALGSGLGGSVAALTAIGSDLYVGGSFTTAGGNSANYIAKWNGSAQAWSALGDGMDGLVSALAAIDNNLYVGGNFTFAGGLSANYIAKWNGSAWSALGDGTNGEVNSLTFIGTDLYASGNFTAAGGNGANRVAKWNGSAWSALGSGVWTFPSAVYALKAVGSELYMGGDFTTESGSPANYIVKWTSSAWTALGTNTNSPIHTIATMNGDLYIGGLFTQTGDIAANRIAKWNGSSWSALGTGLDNDVYTLAVIGSNLYAGGYFTTAGGSPANYIAKWDGNSWSALGSGVNSPVYSLVSINTDLYVGGSFTLAGGGATSHIAKWNGSAWSALGDGVNDYVYSMTAVGSDLYVGGSFTAFGVESASGIAKWNGTSWSALGDGVNGNIYALAYMGTDLYAGGSFSMAGGNAASSIAKWDGSTWSALGDGIGGDVYTLSAAGSDLYVGGWFTSAGGNFTTHIAKWNGSAWATMGSDGTAIESPVNALLLVDDNLYVGGTFIEADGVTANRIAKWNGSAWSSIYPGINNYVYAMTSIDNNLYVGGDFTTIGDIDANHIAKWDGTTWSALGSGLNNLAWTLTVIDNNLYAGGLFTTAGGETVNYIAKWDGFTWSALGSGVNNPVYALVTIGSNLYVGGDFTSAGGIAANYVAKWSDNSWSTLGSGLNNWANVMTAINTDLYVGGEFTEAGGLATSCIAKWNGSTWSALGAGLNNLPYALTAIGNDLYAGGMFTSAGGSAANYIAKWNGSAWSALGTGANSYILWLTALENNIYAGGEFTTISGVSANHIAKWNGSAWSALGTGTNDAIFTMATIGNDLYVGGTFTGNFNSKYLGRWSPSISANTESNAETTSISDTYGNVHILSTNASDALIYRQFDKNSSTWGAEVELAASSATSPNLSIDSSTNSLYAFWIASNTLYYKKGTAPFNAASWTNATTIYNTGTNQHINAEAYDGYGGMLISWTNGSSNPYTIYSDTIPILHSISGTILRDSNALQNVLVSTNTIGDTSTNSSGVFSFSNVPHRTVTTLIPTLLEHTFSPIQRSLIITNDSSSLDFSGTINTYTISGTILQNGVPEAGVTIDGNSLGTTLTNIQGDFIFSEIPYGSSYSLHPIKTNTSFTPDIITGTIVGNTVANFTASTNNSIDPNDPNTDPDDPNSDPDNNDSVGFTISGQLTKHSIAIPDAIITLNNSNGSLVRTQAPQYKTISNQSGSYSFGDIASGSYRLTAEKDSIVIATSIVNINNADIIADLEVSTYTLLATPTYALWNGYLNTQNILELRNKGTETLTANVDIFAYDSLSSTFMKKETRPMSVPKNEQRDIYINLSSAFAPDTYGFVEISTNHNLFDGMMSYYHPSQTTAQQGTSEFNGSFTYAFSLPFENTISGTSHMLINTYYPTPNQNISVYNWLTIVNPNDTIFRANIIYYTPDGITTKTSTIAIRAKSRVDIDGGHETFGSNKVGLIEVQPINDSLPYISALIRYASNNSFALGQTAKLGISSERFLPITNIPSRYGFFEVANTKNSLITLNTKWYDSNGEEAGNKNYRLNAKQIIHIPVHELLPIPSAGTLSFSSDTPQALVGQMAVYEYGQIAENALEHLYAESTQAQESYAQNLFGSYNLYLNMYNWLRVFNATNANTSLTLSSQTNSSTPITITIKPHQRRDIAIHELGIPVNTYGTLTIQTQSQGTIIAQNLRVKTNEFITSAPVR